MILANISQKDHTKIFQQQGQIAQLVEQRTENPCVGGSIPPLATTYPVLIQLDKWNSA